MNQKQMFYQAGMNVASDNLKKMAELQRKAGREDLARDSEKTALARRVSARNLEGFTGGLDGKKIETEKAVAVALEYGEWAVKQNI